MLLLTAKNVAIFFGLATTAFCVSTIVLAVQKADLEDELQDVLDKLDQISTYEPVTITTPTSTLMTSTDPSSSTHPTTDPTDSTPSPGSSSTTEFPWPTITVPTAFPILPTLPSDLPDPEKIVYRLPTDIIPVKYRLHINPDLSTGTITGTVSIQIEVEHPTNLIVMHAKDLEIESVSILYMMTRIRIRVKEYILKPELDLLIIELYEVLTTSPYTVSISYYGRLDGLAGVYKSSYIDENNQHRWIATTKFEPTFARQAFPCFDEPAMKAPFTITIVRPTEGGYHALSNMNIEKEIQNGNETEVEFAESVPMSTYLVAFLVSDFAFKKKTVRGVLPDARDFEMRVFSAPGQKDKTQYALDTGVAITEFYIDYFQIEYPLPKLDMAAIPDFVSGAMENWGLVTFRETALLYDPMISSSPNKQRVATVVAHELAHMWFGNLVTMKWWNDLWLNEGFANFIEYEGVNHVHPEWDMLTQFLIDDLHDVMDLDATLAAHPIVQFAESPVEITELFDAITYSKGASVIRMLKHLVGDEKFRNATTNYLNNFIYINAETEDFLTELEALGFDFDVKVIMQTWTEQMGLPVVNVEKISDTQFKLTQKRFFSNPEDYEGTYTDSQFNYRWSIPITYFSSKDSEVQSLIFNHGDNEVTITVPETVDWLKFNKDEVGYYRVNYPVEMWNALIKALQETRGVFSNADRAHLIADVFALADASQLDYAVALDLTTYLEKELDYVPWAVALAKFGTIRNLLYTTNLYNDFVLYVRRILTSAYEYVSWNVGGDHLQNLLRARILKSACSFGVESALEEAGTRFKAWLENPSERPNPDIRDTIYYYGMASAGNENLWNQVWNLYLAEQDAAEKIKLMEALTAIKEPWILHRLINLAWDERNVRGQDYFTFLQYLSRNPVGQSIVWDYVRDNWQRFLDRFGLGERYLGRVIPQITGHFVTQTKLEEMQAFFAKFPDAGAGAAARKQALEKVKHNINWLKNNKQKVGDWLGNQNSKVKQNPIQ